MLVATSLQQSQYLVVAHDTREFSGAPLDLDDIVMETVHTQPPDFIERLIPALEGPMSYYAAALEPAVRNALEKSVNRGKRGRKPNIALSILIADCNRAYWTAMGRDPKKPYEHQDRHGYLHQSPCVRLARQIHMKVTGKPYPQTMEWQARHARQITFRG